MLVTVDEAGAARPEWDAVIGIWALELPLLFVSWKLLREPRRRGR
ncbi:hypothetical protein [Streptomyces pharetrae]